MTTPLYGMIEWQPNQDQPEQTVNVELRILEIMSARIFIDMTLDEPPTGAEDGQAYYLDGPGAGEWAGQTDKLCLNIAGNWHYVAPREGLIFYDLDSSQQVLYDGSTGTGWSAL